MRSKVLYIGGFVLIILSFLLNFFSVARLVLLIGGILLIDIETTLKLAKHPFIILIIPLFLLVFTYGVDMLLATKLNRVPIYSYEIKSSKNMATYNSFFYRIYHCQNKNVTDYGYQLSYACRATELEEHDINAFLSESLARFADYQNKFVKIRGRVSKISGEDLMELSSYKIDANNTLNGYVEFNTEYRLRLKIKADLSNYKIYDDVTVIGLVSRQNKEQNDTIIELIDAIIVPSTLYENYTLEVIASDSKDLTSYVEKEQIYLKGLSNIYLHFDESHIYELKYLITDKRITIADLIQDSEAKELKDKDDVTVGTIYEKDKFKVIKCQNKKIIISNKEEKIKANICD